METRQLGSLGPVSTLTLGGGGIGQLWGATTREECVATVRAAVDGGITLFDMAPAYGDGEAERVIGEAFEGKLPDHVRVTTKHRLGTPDPEAVAGRLVESLEESLERMRLERIDIYFLHSNIIPDDHDASAYHERPATRWSVYIDAFRPAVEELVRQGRIGAWGITGIGMPGSVLDALDLDSLPAVIQCLANPTDSASELRHYEGPTRAREIIAKSRAHGCGVMGIRAVQGGALVDSLDRELAANHPVWMEYANAEPFRKLAARQKASAAALAHRYALSMKGIDTVVLGIKNREELQDCLAAEAAGPIEADLAAEIETALADTAV